MNMSIYTVFTGYRGSRLELVAVAVYRLAGLETWGLGLEARSWLPG